MSSTPEKPRFCTTCRYRRDNWCDHPQIFAACVNANKTDSCSRWQLIPPAPLASRAPWPMVTLAILLALPWTVWVAWSTWLTLVVLSGDIQAFHTLWIFVHGVPEL